jgi:uncharacterized membrane protein
LRPRAVGTLLIILAVFGGVVYLSSLDLETAGTKSFDLEEVRVRARLQPNGNLLVREFVTYDFDGTFSVGTRDFEPGPYQIVGLRAFEDGERLRTIHESPVLFEWDIAPASGRHTYEVRYRVLGATLAWPDVVELNWQWVGVTSPGIDRHTVHLELPTDRGVRAWAHGPLNGEIRIDGGTVTTEVDDLPASTFVETRVVAPRRAFDPDLPPARQGDTAGLSTIDITCQAARNALELEVQRNPDLDLEELLEASGACDTVAPVETEPQLPRIIAEEEALADQANAERARLAAEAEAAADLRRNLGVATPFVVVFGIVACWLIWRRWGKEPETTDVDYWREVPDDPPAVANALVHWGTPDQDAFSATVVDLAQRGLLTIEELDEGKDYRFRRTDQAADGLLPFEKQVLDKLFEEGPERTQKALTSWAKSHRTSAASWMDRFREGVGEEYDARSYQITGRAAPWLLYLLVAALVGGFGAFALISQAWVAGGVAVGVALVLLFFIGTLRQRTPTGAQRHAEWSGLEKYLEDFSSLEEAPVGHVILYERYLVAAVALGIADEVVEALQVRVPEVVQDSGFATWYVGHPTGAGLRFGTLGAFSSGFAHATASAFRPPASSTSSSGGGFGGGFSGGGGGGGGGGGFGAR